MKSNKLHSDKKKTIIKDYNLSFQYYDRRYQEIQLSKYKRFYKSVQIQNKKVLDAGCGTGLLLEHIFQKKDSKDSLRFVYTGVDISKNMLRMFQMKLKKLGMFSFINLILGDVENLPFRENTFDEIFSITVFQNLTDKGKALEDLTWSGKKKFSFILSILKRDSGVEKFKTIITEKFKNYSLDANSHLEDIIFSGKMIKNEN
ncbi:MAG: class I SAM-dependent methyltransferase [Promethearchaeota archaeon]|nr:MAG: class I SAM-dependent methyltransferase [Candidatus Lokiarchaeota archaeon]